MKEPPVQTPCDKHPAFIVHSPDPLNGGPPLELLYRSDVTPPELFFVRNHGSIPAIDPADYQLAIAGMVERPLAFKLDDLRSQLGQVDINATRESAR